MVKTSFILNFLIFLGCFVFVVFQSTQCLIKFIDAPEGTSVKVKSIASEPSLGVTICNNDLEVAYAGTLASCNLT